MAKISDILKETERLIAVKQASYQGGFKRAQAMDGISGMPGSEHDSVVPSEYGKPDAEVDNGTQGPEGAFSNIEGAGNNADPTMKHVLEVDEPAATPDKEPLITDDADAEPKTAAALANKLLSNIHDFQNTKRAANQQQALKLDSKMLDKLAGQNKEAAAQPAAPAAPATPAAPAAPAAKPAESAPAAPAGNEKKAEEVSPAKQRLLQVVQKIQADKEAEKQAAERAGAEAAVRDALNAAYEQGVTDAVAHLTKLAQEDPAVAAALPQGDAAAAAAQMATPAPVAEADAGAGEAVSVPEGAEGQDVTVEDVVEALNEAVNAGEIEPQVAEQVLSELAVAADSAAGAPEETAPADKEAAEKFASAIREANAEIEAQLAKQAAAVKQASSIPTAGEVTQAVSELVDEGKLDAATGAAILNRVGVAPVKQASAPAPAPAAQQPVAPQTKQAAEIVKALAQGYRQSKEQQKQAEFQQAIKEASDELDAACAAAAADGGDKASAGSDEGAGAADITPEDLVEGLAELVQSGEISAEDAEDALHAIIGGEG